MEWRTIPGFHTSYQVNDEGYVRKWNGHTFEEWPRRVAPNGYYRISVPEDGSKKTVYVHRLVALAFIPNPENKPHTNHKDSNRANPRAANLEWVTPKENHAHAVSVGRIKTKGSEHPSAKLTDAQVEEIKQHLAARKLHMTEIGRLYGVTGTAIGYIRQGGRSSASIKEKAIRYSPTHPKKRGYCAYIARGEKAAGCKHSNEKIREIRRVRAQGYSCAETARICGCSSSLVDSINHGHRSDA